jgi:predicted metal-dependent HD superfamily phosphohydrolase
VIGCYSEAHRSYHVQHLDECFAELQRTSDLAEHIHEVELALWFHDAVYDIRSQDNILGSPVDRFDEYEQQVRKEYSWVPGWLFRRKRREILEAFLARPHIFNTQRFRATHEAQARANLERSILALGGS